MFAAVSALGVSRDPVCLCAKTRTQDSHERGRTSMGTNTVHNCLCKYKYKYNDSLKIPMWAAGGGVGFFMEDKYSSQQIQIQIQ